MQLREFDISGLFGELTHTIHFPVPKEGDSAPSLVILHGRNGVGKTTLLRMLDGVLRLDFDQFRVVPFDVCSLKFDTGDVLRVKALKEKHLLAIEVQFANKIALLHPKHSGALSDEQTLPVTELRELFFKRTETLAFEFIDTERLYTLQEVGDEEVVLDAHGNRILRGGVLLRGNVLARTPHHNPKAKARTYGGNLASRVKRFIQEAQINYRTFFSTNEPDLFSRIIERLTANEQPIYEVNDLRSRFEKIHFSSQENARLGLEPDKWDYGQIMTQLDALSRRRGQRRSHALTVLGSYAEQLESRAAERALVADRLVTFERLMKQFLAPDKSVSIHPKAGLMIQTKSGQALRENQLSTGEFHLLFLMVAALVTRRTGTIIAIDEPEMSMHLAWQRQLIPALVQCASRANPLFIFATHSPDVVASFPDAMVELR